MDTFEFNSRESFLKKLEELPEKILKEKSIILKTPYPVHEAEHIISKKESKLKYFTLAGGVPGLVTGFAFPVLTVVLWPLASGGKPDISIPAFVIIAFELLILFGALFSFAGFLILSGLPDIRNIIAPDENGNRFVIIVKEAPGAK